MRARHGSLNWQFASRFIWHSNRLQAGLQSWMAHRLASGVHEPSAGAAPTRVLTSDFLDGTALAGLAVIILNWRLPSITPRLLAKASIRVCADGGANRLHDEVPAMFPDEPADAVRARFLPHLIKGDLDSIRHDVVAFYRSHGVPIVDLSADQESTDLDKCVRYLQRIATDAGGGTVAAGEQGAQPDQQRQRLPADTVVAVGAHGGRLDHILSNLSVLHAFRDMHIVLCGDGNLTRLIPAGRAIIRPDRGLEGPACGLVPLQGPAVASTRGLRWDLQRTEMRIGALVSTSNILEADEVEVESDADLVWTTQLRERREAAEGREGGREI